MMQISSRQQKTVRTKRTGGNMRGSGRSAARGASRSALQLQRAVGNHDSGIIARSDGAEESHARAVADEVRRTPSGTARLTGGESTNGARSLSEEGRRYFEPIVGSGIDRARIHIGGRADRIADLAGAEALAYGDDIFIPRNNFSTASPEGRALLGHELAHVARPAAGPPRIHRKEKPEPHYPTPDEQKRIEKLMGREFKNAPAQTPATPDKTADGATPDKPADTPEPVVVRGRSLDEAGRQAMIQRLTAPYLAVLASQDPGSNWTPPSAIDAPAAYKVVEKARADIFSTFGDYASRAIALTQDKKTTIAGRRAADQVLVTFEDAEQSSRPYARTIATTDCATCSAQLQDLDDDSRGAVIDALVEIAYGQHHDQLIRATRAHVGGVANRERATINLPLAEEANMYHRAVHELMHLLAHPAFRAAFGNEDTINEGFTEYMTRKVVTASESSYAKQVSMITSIRDAMNGPFLIGMNTEATEESLRLAYFKGRLDLIGWRPSGPEEQKAVEAAGGSTAWDPTVAKTYAETYRQQAIAAQAPSRNVIGMGIYFNKDSASSDTISVRYARVLARTEPYARGQLLAEGQLWGSPITKPSALGASLGIAGEYQEPYFYAGGGVRFVGTAFTDERKNRLDISPFVGAGFRAWQTIRIGGEGFVLLPIAGEGIQLGGGVTLGVEFK